MAAVEKAKNERMTRSTQRLECQRRSERHRDGKHGRVRFLASQARYREIVGILYVARVGVGLRAQPVQRVIDILNRLALAVGLREQIADQVVGVALG